MTTESSSFPAECHRGTLLGGQSSAEALHVENENMPKKVTLTTSADDSWVPPSEGALISFDEDAIVGHSPAPVQKDGSGNESFLSLLTSAETFKMADDGQGQDGGHFVLRDQIPDPSLEQPKSTEASSLSAQGEDSSPSVSQSKMIDAVSDAPTPVENSQQMTEGDEEGPHDLLDIHPSVVVDALKQLELLDTSSELGHGGEEESSRGHAGDPSKVWSELQESSVSSQTGIEAESRENAHHGVNSAAASEFPAQPEASGCPEERTRSVENTQHYLPPQSPNLLLQGSDSPSHEGEESWRFPPGHDPSGASSAKPRETFDAADIHAGQKPSVQVTMGTGEEERTTGRGEDVGALLLEETPAGDSQVRQDSNAQHRDCKAHDTFQALASTDPPSSVGTGGQQRAPGTGCEDTFPEAVPALSPVATTGDSLEPAPGGLTAGREKEAREGMKTAESSATSSYSKPLGEVGGTAVPESEKGPEEAVGDSGPDSATREVSVPGAPSLESQIGTSPEEPSGATVLARARESLDAGQKEDPHDLSGVRYLVATSQPSDSQAEPRRDLFDSNTEDRMKVMGPVSGELEGQGTDWMENEARSPGNRCPATETPIEREIRLHLEREELLRQQRGLASARGTQEYVEVRIRPFLNQGMPPSPLAKEKELQWAGVQMQREIQRECQREDDLVQLGKVRGAYDRGTPQELQEKKMIFEQQAAPDSLAPVKTTAVSSSSEGTTERSFAETDGASGLATVATGNPFRPLPERPSTANPFFCLQAKSPQSILEREVKEAQERERELQRQRRKIYGSAIPQQLEEASDQEEEEVPFQPERPPCKKLDVTWPPPSPSEPCQVNGLHQLERSPRSRQKSALIQRWESGTVGNQENQD